MSGGAGSVNGVVMSSIKTIDGFAVPEESTTLLVDLDFTTMASASWLGADTISLSGQTWKVGNRSNANELGPNGSYLKFSPKGADAGDWWTSGRTGPYLSIKLNSIDENFTASPTNVQYVAQVVCEHFPSCSKNYARFMTGFWSDADDGRGYTSLFGIQHNGTDNDPASEFLYYYLGSGDEDKEACSTGELTFYSYLNPTGFNSCRTSTSQDGNTPLGGSAKGEIFAAASNPNKAGAQPTLLCTASAEVNVGIVGVGYNGSATNGPTFKLQRFRVWRVEPKS
jgi:hypothetical protein